MCAAALHTDGLWVGSGLRMSISESGITCGVSDLDRLYTQRHGKFHTSRVHVQRLLDRDAQCRLESPEDGKMGAVRLPSPQYAGNALIVSDIWCLTCVDCL